MPRSIAFMRHLTVAQAEEIKMRVESDEKITVIAESLGLEKPWPIYDFTLAFGIDSPSYAKKKERSAKLKSMFGPHHDKIVELGAKGYSLNRISKVIDCDVKELRRYATNNGIKHGKVTHEEWREINRANGSKALKQQSQRVTKPKMSKAAMIALGMRC